MRSWTAWTPHINLQCIPAKKKKPLRKGVSFKKEIPTKSNTLSNHDACCMSKTWLLTVWSSSSPIISQLISENRKLVSEALSACTDNSESCSNLNWVNHSGSDEEQPSHLSWSTLLDHLISHSWHRRDRQNLQFFKFLQFIAQASCTFVSSLQPHTDIFF